MCTCCKHLLQCQVPKHPRLEVSKGLAYNSTFSLYIYLCGCLFTNNQPHRCTKKRSSYKFVAGVHNGTKRIWYCEVVLYGGRVMIPLLCLICIVGRSGEWKVP